MRRFILLAFGVALATLLSAQPSSTFFSTFDAERGNALAPARDGNLWLAGMKNERILLAKITPGGKIIEEHSFGFDAVADLDTENLVEFFEESDGTLVGCGNFENDNQGRGFVFRFDPVQQQRVWAYVVRSGDLNYLSGIARLGPGGDYVLYGNPHFTGSNDAELLRLDRQTGQIVTGKRLGIGSSDNISQTVYHNGALYACGRMTNDGGSGFGNFARMRNAICKLDTATLQPMWTRIGPLPSSASARLYGRDLIIDNEAIISTYSGDATGPDLFSSTIFLQKNDLAGNLLWAKQYDLPEFNGEFAEEVIALPDGYMLYGHDLLDDFSRLFLLKTDKQGNPLSAVKIDFDANEEFSETPARAKILRLGDALFFTAISQNNLGQTQGILAKTDLDGWLGDSCSFFKKTTAQLVAMPAPVSEVVVPPTTVSPATLTLVTNSATLPDLVFSKKCGASGTCTTLPDLRLTLDSITCNNGDPRLHYTFCNVGGQVYEGSAFFGLYDRNPFTDSAKLVTLIIYPGNLLAPDECTSGFVSSQLDSSTLFDKFRLDTFQQFFALMGINLNAPTPIALSNFPFTPNQPECGYLNNLSSLTVPPQLCGDCEKPITFIKTLGSPQRREEAYSMCKSADGNLYLLGKQESSPMIAKINSLGEPIWVRNFPVANPNILIEPTEIIEDSEGKLVFCGTWGGSPSNRQAIAMRYDPVADNVLWFRAYPDSKPYASSILEQTPGGNFILQNNYQETVGGMQRTRSEILELERATGVPLPALSVRYLGEPHLSLHRTVAHDGNLYAVGTRNDGSNNYVRPVFCKISATDGQPVWSQITEPDTTTSLAKIFGHADIVFDHNFAIIVGNGQIDPKAPTEGVFVYLEKHTDEGKLLWAKRYDLPMWAEGVISLNNAYIVFGRMIGSNQFGMLKTDPHGNVLQASMLTAAMPSLNSVGYLSRQNLLLPYSLQLMMLDNTFETNGQGDIVLLRTDTNFDLDDNCDRLMSVAVSATDLPAKVLPFTLPTAAAPQNSFTLTTSFQSDFLEVRKLCPECPCEGTLDLTFRVKQTACAADSSVVFRAEVCNIGKAVLIGSVPVTFFDKNPLTEEAQAVWTVNVEIDEPGLASGGCTTVEWPLPGIAQQYTKLYSLLGVDNSVIAPISLAAFPLQGPDECNYINNLDSFAVKIPVCDGCENPTTFIKTMGRADQTELGYSLCNSADGNVYMAGRQGDNPMIAKMTPNGEMLWVRNFPTEDGPFDDIDLVGIIEDSEGKLVLCGTRNHSPNTRRAVVMRYDPATNQALWLKQYTELYPEVMGIFEKTPDGNFVIYSYSDEIFNGGGPIGGTYYRTRSQVWELDRATGEVVPTLATLFPGNPSTSVYFQDMVPHNGNFYCVGGWFDHDISGSGRAMLAKLSALDGTPEWVRGTLPDTAVQFQFFNWRKVLVDNGQLVALGYGLTDINLPTQKNFVFLSKYDLDGKLLWMKSYQSESGAEDLVALPDGYAIFGRAGSSFAWGMLKTDKDGNLLTAKKLALSTTGLSYQFFRQNQLLPLPNHLMMVSDYRSGTYTDIVLLKTDNDFNLDDSCGLLQPLPVQVATRAPKTNPLNIAFQPYAVTAVNKTTVFQTDSLNIRQWCPQCPCTDKPDITFQLDSLYCSATDGPTAIFRVCNQGLVSASTGFSLTFYDKNPLSGAAQPLFSTLVPAQPGFGDCVSFKLSLDSVLLSRPQLFTLAGVWKDVQTPISLSDFPFSGGFAECDYANNLDSFEVNLSVAQKPDLGPDRSICTGQTVTLDAGGGYATYLWLGSGVSAQTITVGTADNYIVEVTDVCGNTLRDTVLVNVLPYPKRTVEVVLLPGDSIIIDGTTYFGTTIVRDTIPTQTGGCDTVATYEIRLDSLHCSNPASFLKTYKGGLGRVLQPSADGGYYIAGETSGPATASHKAIVKMDAAGKILWTRTFDFLQDFIFVALKEDSEGKLILLASSSAAPSSTAVVRYDPINDQILWVKRMATPPQTNILAFDLFEKKPDGDFMVTYVLRNSNNELATEICSFDRTTGNLLNGGAWRYDLYSGSAALDQGAVYFNGLLRDPAVQSAISYRYGLMKIDLNTGNPLWAQLTTPAQPGLDFGSGGIMVDNAGDVLSTVSQPGKAIGLQKTTSSGALIWLKKFQFSDPLANTLVLKNIVSLKDGYLFAADALSNATTLHAIFLIKTNFNGDLIWAKKLPSGVTGYDYGNDKLLAVRDGKGCFLTNALHQNPLFNGMAIGQMDADGNLGDGCSLLENVLVTVSDQPATQDPVLATVSTPGRTFDALPQTTSQMARLLPNTVCTKCLPSCEDVAVEKTIAFYPGDTIVIDGTAYTQSATVVQTFTTAAGCDSVITNILQLVITDLEIKCPANFTVTLPSGETTAVVDYELPTATTNCPDPTIDLRLLQGPPVGGTFQQGTTLVCYEAANQCGIRDTCCFTITAEQPDAPCDVKIPVGCLRYELLGIRLDALGQPRYRVRITNACTSPVAFVYLQLPNGVLAVSPKDGATYLAPSGNTYSVRNPNASPFYSIRFKPVVENLNNGKSDVFEYTLPQQSQPAYIRAMAKLADGTSSTAYLNTFFCPVQPYTGMENLGLKTERTAQPAHAQFSVSHAPLSVWPNPTDGRLYLDLSHWQGQSLNLQVMNAQGQILVLQRVVAAEGVMEMRLPEGVVNGLYHLRVLPESDATTGQQPTTAAVRFVVER